MIMKHEHYDDAAVDVEMDKQMEIFIAQYFDDYGLVYSIQYKIEDSDE